MAQTPAPRLHSLASPAPPKVTHHLAVRSLQGSCPGLVDAKEIISNGIGRHDK